MKYQYFKTKNPIQFIMSFHVAVPILMYSLLLWGSLTHQLLVSLHRSRHFFTRIYKPSKIYRSKVDSVVRRCLDLNLFNFHDDSLMGVARDTAVSRHHACTYVTGVWWYRGRSSHLVSWNDNLMTVDGGDVSLSIGLWIHALWGAGEHSDVLIKDSRHG